MTRKGYWIQTYTGIHFWPLDPRPEEISIFDIAHSLANQCRWGGHVRRFYSVAEHSIHVALHCPNEFRLYGLLHDAAEAYLQDIVRPMKRLEMFCEYKAAEDRLLAMIFRRYGLPPDLPEDVKRADNLMLAIEGRELMKGCVPVGAPDIGDLEYRLRGWAPITAKVAFLERFHTLTNGRLS